MRDPIGPTGALVVMVWVTLLLGCAGTAGRTSGGAGGGDITPLLDREARVSARVRATDAVDARVEAGLMTATKGRELLKKAAWDRRSPVLVRAAAIRSLADDPGFEGDTRRMFELMLPTEVRLAGHAEIVGVMADISVDRGWRGLSPALVRSWSESMGGVAVDERPEARALARLFPGRTVRETVWGVLTGDVRGTTGEALGEAERRAAWGVLVSITSSEEDLRSLVRSRSAGADDGGLVGLLARSERELGVLPRSAGELAWLERLAASHRGFWSEASSAVSGLDAGALRGLELRHLPGIVYASRFDQVALSMSRAALLDGVSEAIGPRRGVWRSRDRGAGPEGEALEGWRDELVWGDALLLRIAAALTEAPSVEFRRAIAELGDRDMQDTTTEHGGVLDADEGGGLVMYHYPPRPRDRVSDRRMVASPALIEAGTTAMFHFHLHAQRYENTPYAGPSGGDFEYARSHGRSCIVLTFLDENTLNVDYYQPDGAVIDLGVIERPG